MEHMATLSSSVREFAWRGAGLQRFALKSMRILPPGHASLHLPSAGRDGVSIAAVLGRCRLCGKRAWPQGITDARYDRITPPRQDIGFGPGYVPHPFR